MPDQIVSFSLSQFHNIANIVIGGCYIFIAAAFLAYFARREGTRQRWTFVLLCLFFVLAGLSRIAKGILTAPTYMSAQVTLDLLAAALGVPMAIIVWPLLSRLGKLPTTQQLEKANQQLEESNKKLMHSQQLFESFMRYSPSLQYVKDAQLRFLYVNDAVCQTFAVSRESILGRTTQEWMPAEVATTLHQSDMRVLQTMQPTEEFHTIPTPKGARTWLIVKFPVWDEQFMIGAIGIDVTEQKASEEREAKLTRLFREMVIAVKEYAIFMLDPQGNILTWNEGAQRLKGYKADEIIGKNFSIFYPPEVDPNHPQEELAFARQHGQYQEEGWRLRKDGSRFWANVTITAVHDDGNLIGFTKVTRDMTEQKNAKERESRITTIFRNMVSAVKEYAIVMLDPEGNILTWNEGAERVDGYTADEAIGKNFAILYGDDAVRANHPQEELALAKEHGQYQEEGWRLRKDGTHFWASVAITPVYVDGALIGFTKVTRDMTDRRDFETELEVQRDKALEASAAKSAFVANISHEIRTPLSGILGMNELLLQTELTDEQRELAQTVQDSSQSLLTVLNDVLDLSKVEAGRLFLEKVPFNVTFATQDATRLMSATAKNKGLVLKHQIDTRIPELLVGDPERFRQILLNLVGNAVKFTQKGEVSVTAELIAENRTTAVVKFAVKDTGIGIAQEDRKFLFVPFGQVDASSTRKHGGTGLGLTISKHLVQMMGGEIGLDSEKGKGSTFWFTIPFPKTAEQPADLSARGSGLNMPTEPTALIVEDNTTLQDLAVKQLANLGIKSALANSGAGAIEAVNGTQFDLILMDISLPHMDGYEAARIIRSIESTRNRRTPIVAMTANAMHGDREKALDAGMDDYIAKPVSLDKLRKICEKWLARGKGGYQHADRPRQQQGT